MLLADHVLADPLPRLSVEEMLLPILVQLAVIIVAARLFAVLFRKIGQPSVVGEIVAGLVLGPSVLGRLWPPLSDAIFHPTIAGLTPELSNWLLGGVLTTLSQVGLILLLFLIGLEFDFSHLRWHGKSALAIAVAGIALPFALGFGVASLLHPLVAEHVAFSSFTLFFSTALSITAIPVLGRIMMELNITRTRLGTVTIAAAAVDDAVGWILLAAVAAIVRSEFQPRQILWMIGETLAFTAVMILVARPLLRRWVRFALGQGDGELSVTGLAILLAVMLGCAIATNFIGIFAVFGAFLLGAVLSSEHDFRLAINRRLRDFVAAFFLPLFFAYTGLRTDVGSLESWQLWLLCVLVIAAAVVGKLGGCALAAWLAGSSPREAGCIGTMMSTRGLMALVVINLGKDLGVIPDSVFCMLVFMAIVTTVMTTPLLVRLARGTELEPFIARSPFMAGRSVRPAAVPAEVK